MRPHSSVYSRVLLKAIELRGGVEDLAAHLGYSPMSVRRWLDGTEQMPLDVFLAAVDLVMDSHVKTSGAPPRSSDRNPPRSVS